MTSFKRFIMTYVPGTVCNLRCEYCFLREQNRANQRSGEFLYSPERIKQALSPGRLGGRCLFYFSADGETLFQPEVLPILHAVVQLGHFAIVVSNMTLNNRVDEILTWAPELRKNLLFMGSLHFTELKRSNRLSDFFDNLVRLRNAGCSCQARLCLCDEYLPLVSEIQTTCRERLGHLPVLIPYIPSEPDKYRSPVTEEERERIAVSFQSPLYYELKRIVGVKVREFCHAGDWSFVLNAGTGEFKRCLSQPTVGNIFENPDSPLPLAAVGQCPRSWCMCGTQFLSIGTVPEVSFPTYTQLFCRENENSFSEYAKQSLDFKLNQY